MRGRFQRASGWLRRSGPWWVAIGLLAGAHSARALDPAVRIGNPLLARYPVSGDARPRSIWDLHVFDGRLYLAHGDYWNNRGPIDLWTYSGDGTNFVNEYVVSEEMVWDFFEYDGKLFIPGYDARSVLTPTSVHIHDPQRTPDPGWVSHATLSAGMHCHDVALFQGRLYASITLTNQTGRTMVSTNMGLSWSTLFSRYTRMVVFDEFIWFEGTQGTAQGPVYWHRTFDGETVREVSPSTGISTLQTARRVRYGDGVLYVQPARWLLAPTPLYFIAADEVAAGGAAAAVPAFANANVRDVVVRGDICFVLTAEEIETDARYRGTVHVSDDLQTWVEACAFEVPGIPLSFEVFQGQFHVGLGSRFDEGVGWSRLIGPESGSLWRVEQRGFLDDLDPLTPGQVTLEAQVIPGLPFRMEVTPSLETPEWTTLAGTAQVGRTFFFTTPTDPGAPIQYFRIRQGEPEPVPDAPGPDQIAHVRGTPPALTWFVDETGDREADRTFTYAAPGDRPVVADFDGDGLDDIAVARPYEGLLAWHCDLDGDGGTDRIFAYGVDGDRAVAGDLNGDGRDDVAVTRDEGGQLVWYTDTTGDGAADLVFAYGEAGDQAVVGDFDGDGADDIAITRDYNGVLAWHVDLGRTGATDWIFAFGAAGDLGAAGRLDEARPAAVPSGTRENKWRKQIQ